MPDIIVTTPKRFMAASAKEAELSKADFLKHGTVAEYFRNFPATGAAPPLEPGDRIYYVEDGAVRGYLVVGRVEWDGEGITCGTHGIQWPPGTYAFSMADTWRWIRPVLMTGFQGWRYADRCGITRQSVTDLGGWLDDAP